MSAGSFPSFVSDRPYKRVLRLRHAELRQSEAEPWLRPCRANLGRPLELRRGIGEVTGIAGDVRHAQRHKTEPQVERGIVLVGLGRFERL